MSYMNPRYLKLSDGTLLEFGQNFLTVGNANLADTGLTVGEMTELNDLYTDFSTAVGTHVAAYTAARMSTLARDNAKAPFVAKLRALAQTVRSRSETPNTLKEELWLNAPPAPPAPAQPVVPQGVEATGTGYGYNKIKWERGANPKDTIFVVQYKPYGTETWFVAGLTMKTRFKHTGQAAGVKIDYCVYAQRGDLQSPQSIPSTAWGSNQGGQSPNLQIAA